MGFADFRRGKTTGYNVALRELIKKAIIGSYPDYDIDYSKVQISVGSLLKPLGAVVEANEPGIITLSWTYTGKVMGSYEADEPVVVLYNVQQRLHMVVADPVFRSAESLDIELPGTFSGDELAVWMFFVNREHQKQSKSVFVGMVTTL